MADSTLFSSQPATQPSWVIRRREKIANQLGMPKGTASNKLRKAIIFSLAKRLGLLSCYRCNKEIADVGALSIEHKESWENAPNACELFFDIGNVCFSHLACNVAAAKRTNKIHADDRERWRVTARNNRPKRLIYRKKWRDSKRAAGLPVT